MHCLITKILRLILTFHYEMDTCLNRVLMISYVQSFIKQRLTKLRNTINILKLTEEIQITTEALSMAYDKK